MTLELDKRIKDRKYIFDCFNSNEAKKFIGKGCYLTDKLSGFSDVRMLKMGILTSINANGLFFCGSNVYAYCLPIEFVAPKEKKFRPYTLEEFNSHFNVGESITFRPQGESDNGQCLVLESYKRRKDKDTIIYMGIWSYTLDELFEDYEWYDDADHWKPFGLEISNSDD